MVAKSHNKIKVETYVGLGDLAHDDGVIDRSQVRSQASDARPSSSSTSHPDTSFGLLINAGGHTFNGGRITGPPTQLSEPILKSVQELFKSHRTSVDHPIESDEKFNSILTPTELNSPESAVPYSRRALQHDKTILNSLSNNRDLSLGSVARHGKTKALFNITQTEIRYDIHDSIPYSILGFRLEHGEDRVRCLETKLTGTFTQNDRYGNVQVTDLRHVPVKLNQLDELQIQRTSSEQAQIQAGFDGKPVALVNISGVKAEQYTHTARQRIDAHFNGSQAEGSFDLILGLDKGAEKVLSVIESVFFFMVLRLEQERQPMQLKLDVAIRYVPKGWQWFNQNESVMKSFTVEYSGQRNHDIIKN